MKTIIVTLPDGSQVGIRPIAGGGARVIFRAQPWDCWSPPLTEVAEGDNLTASSWHSRD